MKDTDNKRIDKYKAVWLSHSSISDYKKCQKLYYFQNLYKNPKTNKKINISSPYKALGIAVHGVLEPLNKIVSNDRDKQNLLELFEKEWSKHISIAGFDNDEQAQSFKNRGIKMLETVMSDMKLLQNRTISQQHYYEGELLPNIYLDEYENIILCGNIDWIEYNENDKSLSVIDFKTGKREESEDSLQLPIYKILLQTLQNKWQIKNGKYWYLETGQIVEKEITQDTIEKVKKDILSIGIEIRDKRFVWNEKKKIWENLKNIENNFVQCNNDNCDCHKYQKIINGQAKLLGVDIYGKEVYKV